MAYKDFNTPVDEEKVSRINAAGIINVTLENLWREAFGAMTKGDLVTWNRKLDALWLILGGDVKEKDNNDKEFNKIDLQLHNTGTLSHKAIGFNQVMNKENSSLQYLILRKKSLFLRRLQNSQGKGTAYESTDDGDFD
jgi:hypothetical protein